MAKRPLLCTSLLVALLLTFLLVGCAKEEPVPPTTDASAQRSTTQDTRRGDQPSATDRDRLAQEDALRRRAGQAREDFTNKHIYFAFDQYDLSGEARATLDQKATFLNDNPNVRVQIEGHADERGTNAYNLALGERRANAAKQYLTTLGISAGRLSTISYGEERPADPGQGEGAWARNRRAQFVLLQ
jgi:peptidoglycan-associated lipoprotein